MRVGALAVAAMAAALPAAAQQAMPTSTCVSSRGPDRAATVADNRADGIQVPFGSLFLKSSTAGNAGGGVKGSSGAVAKDAAASLVRSYGTNNVAGNTGFDEQNVMQVPQDAAVSEGS